MHGRLTIGGYHSNRSRCIVYFSTSTYICSCLVEEIISRGYILSMSEKKKLSITVGIQKIM